MSEKRKARKTLEEISLIDDLLMNLVASDPNVGEESIRIMLSVLLQRDFSEIRVTSQRIMPGTDTNVRGIRLDVEVEERIDKDGVERVANIYDIEPHRKDYTDLPRRNRYYQAKIDSKRLPIGAKTFTKLPDLYIIMILDHDPFGKDQVVYTFRNHCVEDPSITYQDGLTIMFFNTKGTIGGSQSIKNMLNYIQNNAVSDAATERLEEYVNTVRSDPMVKEEIMTLGEYFDREREEGRAEGRAEGIAEGRAEGRAEGIAEGKTEGKTEGKRELIFEILSEMGAIPSALKDRIDNISDPDELNRLAKLVAKAATMQEVEKALRK